MKLKTTAPKALFLGLLLTSTATFAQNLYIKPIIGTTLPLIKTQFNQVDENIEPLIQETDFTDGSSSAKNATGNLGRGIKLGLAAGNMFNDNMGFELGVDYLKGKEQTIAKSTFITPTEPSIFELKARIWSIAITPSIYFQGNGEKLIPYGRVGLYVPLGGKMFIDATIVDPEGYYANNTGTFAHTSTTKITSSFTLGYQGAFGAKYILSESISAYAEIQILDFNSVGKETEVESFNETITTADGTIVYEKQLDELTTYEKQRVYVDEINDDSNVQGRTGYDENKPKNEMSSYLNLSAVSLNFGVFINL